MYQPSLRSEIFALLLSLVMTCAPLPSQAQQPATKPVYSPQQLDEMKRLQEAALASDYAYRQVAHLCNSIGHRLSGSAQAEHAVRHVAEELRKLGLDVHLEKVMVPRWIRGEEQAELVEYFGQAPGTVQKLALKTLGGSIATSPDGVTAEVIVVENFEQLAALGRDKVAGKVVLFNVKYDKQMAEQGYAGDAYGQAVAYRGAGASAAARLGATAALIRSVGSADFRLPHTGALRYADNAPRIPAAAVAAEDAELIAYLAVRGKVRLRLKLTPQTLADAESHNVIADIKGSEQPEQIVIVSGHLDSWDVGTGALDDAVGVGAAMQVAQVIKQLGLKPKRTIRIIAWMNEENGLRGGLTYAQNQAAQIGNHFAAIEMDLGAGHPLGFQAHVSQTAQPVLAPIAAVLNRQGAGLINFVTSPVGADISPLENQGVPGFSPLNDTRTYFHYHHTEADTLDKVNPLALAQNAAVLTVLAYALASLSEPLPKQP